MNITLESLAVYVSMLPTFGPSRGFNLKKGKVVIADNEISLVSRWDIGGDNIYNLLYSEIDKYSITIRGIWIRHHSRSVPRYILVRKHGFRNRAKGNEELHKLSQALEVKGIKSY